MLKNHIRLALLSSPGYCSDQSRLSQILSEEADRFQHPGAVLRSKEPTYPAAKVSHAGRGPWAPVTTIPGEPPSPPLADARWIQNQAPNHPVLGKRRDNSAKIGADITSLQSCDSSREPVAPGRHSASWRGRKPRLAAWGRTSIRQHKGTMLLCCYTCACLKGRTLLPQFRREWALQVCVGSAFSPSATLFLHPAFFRLI